MYTPDNSPSVIFPPQTRQEGNCLGWGNDRRGIVWIPAYSAIRNQFSHMHTLTILKKYLYLINRAASNDMDIFYLLCHFWAGHQGKGLLKASGEVHPLGYISV